MIFCSVLFDLRDFEPSKHVFEQSALRYDLHRSGSVVVSQTTTDGKKKTQRSTELSWVDPDRASGWVKIDGETQHFYLDKFRSVRYRSDLKQYIPYTKDEKVSLRAAALVVEPRLEDIPLMFTEPGQTAKFYEPFAKIPGWKTAVKDGQVVLTNSINNISYEFHFSARDFSLEYQRVKQDSLVNDWTLKPGPGIKSFKAGREDVRVMAFARPLPEPAYADKAAQQAVARMFKAYDRPDWLAFEIRDRDQTTRVLLKGMNLRQVDEKADVSYDGENVAVWDKGRNTLYEGRAKSVEMMAVLGAAGTRLDPMVQQLVTNVNPFRSLLSRDAKVKVAMKTQNAQGEAVTLLEVKTPVDTMNLAVRDSDGKVLSMMTTMKGGSAYASSQRVFEYLPKSQVEGAAFKLSVPANAKRRPVNDIVAKK